MTLIIVLGIIPKIADAQTSSYPTDEEIHNLMPDFQRQVDYWNQYPEPEHQNEARIVQENWLQHNPSVSSFLGTWVGWEETMDIYPSTTEDQVCIIYTSEPENSFSLGNIFNHKIYTDAGEVILKKDNDIGVVWTRQNLTGVAVFRLTSPTQSLPSESFTPEIVEQFKAANCIANVY